MFPAVRSEIENTLPEFRFDNAVQLPARSKFARLAEGSGLKMKTQTGADRDGQPPMRGASQNACNERSNATGLIPGCWAKCLSSN